MAEMGAYSRCSPSQQQYPERLGDKMMHCRKHLFCIKRIVLKTLVGSVNVKPKFILIFKKKKKKKDLKHEFWWSGEELCVFGFNIYQKRPREGFVTGNFM